MSSRINRTYLTDRVHAATGVAIQKMDAELGAQQKAYFKEFLATQVTSSLAKEMTTKRRKLRKLEDELTEKRLYWERQIPGITFHYDEESRCTIGIDTSMYSSRYGHEKLTPPSDIEAFRVALVKERDERREKIASLSEAFTDRVMLGDATYEDFKALLTALKEV